MGICNSCESASVVTAKLIHQDGRLQEFPNPVKVSLILERNPNCFICSSDEMDFDITLCTIDEEDHLQLGELYFALPLSWLNGPISIQEMGALAVKASQALNLGGSNYNGKKFFECGFDKKMEPLLLPNYMRVARHRPRSIVTNINGGDDDGVACGSGGRVRKIGEGRISTTRFTAKLTVILEEQID